MRESQIGKETKVSTVSLPASLSWRSTVRTMLASLGAACSLLVILGTLGVSAAQADSPIQEFTVTTSTTQAGGHPDISLTWHGFKVACRS